MEKVTEISTDLRTIRLGYNQQTDLTEFEIDFLERYKQLHCDTKEFLDKIDTFSKCYIEVKHLFGDAKSRFEIQLTLHKELMTFNEKVIPENDTFEIRMMEQKMEEYNSKNDDLKELLVILNDKFGFAWNLHADINKMDNEIDASIEAFREMIRELYHNHQKYEIDIVQFDADEQEFLEILGGRSTEWIKTHNDFCNFADEYSDLAGRYNAFIKFVDEHREIRATTIPFPEAPVPDLGKRHFQIKPGDAKISQYAPMLDKAAEAGNGLEITVDLNKTVLENAKEIVDIIHVSQHKEKWISNIVFNIDLSLRNSVKQGSDLINPLENKKLLQLFDKLGKTNPMIFFFLRNIDFGVMCLAADIILAPDAEIRDDVESDDEEYPFSEVGFSGENLNLIFERFFDGCVAFNLYCDTTKIDTRHYIEWAIDKMRENFGLERSNIEMSFEDVVEYTEKIKALPYRSGNSLN